ncbi:MAG: hypothetical protein ACOVQC_06345 [Flavobacterium sp.]
MKKQSVFLISLFSLILTFTSCGKDNVTVEIGKEFKIDENPITIVKLEETKVLRSTKDEMVQMAPKGKKYVYLEVKNPNKEMIFLKAFIGENELKAEENLYDYTHDIDTGFEDDYYLVDENVSINKIVITTPSETEYAVLKPTATKSKSTITEEVQKVVDSYTTTKAIGLLQGFTPYVKDGKSVFDIAKQEGQIIASNIMSNKAEVTYFSEDGKKYVFKITNVLGGTSMVTSIWENGKVTSLEVVEN